MLEDWAPVGARNINTLRSHPNAFTLRNRRARRNEVPETSFKTEFRVGFGTAAYRMKPWKSDLELIEGKCGSHITSYFIFLRRLISLNIILCLISFAGIGKVTSIGKDHEQMGPGEVGCIRKINLPIEKLSLYY